MSANALVLVLIRKTLWKCVSELSLFLQSLGVRCWVVLERAKVHIWCPAGPRGCLVHGSRSS